MLGIGPLFTFAAGAWVGYTLACVNFMCGEIADTRENILRFPRILGHILDTELPMAKRPTGMPLATWFETGGIAAKSWCILASQSSRPHVQEIYDGSLHSIVESYNED